MGEAALWLAAMLELNIERAKAASIYRGGALTTGCDPVTPNSNASRNAD